MNSEPRPFGAEDGFTLIEVMVAMVILAIGLLGLEALGIGAARSIALAESQSEYTMLAMRRMEDQIRLVRNDPASAASLGSAGLDAETGLWYEAQVIVDASLPTDVAKIVIRVRKSEASAHNEFEVSSFVYDSSITP